MPINTLIQNFLINIEKSDEDKNIEFPSIIEVYKKSIIDWDDLYESIIVMSAETSNNFDVINNMEFYKFMALTEKLSKYLDAKNNPGEGNQQPDMNETMQQMNANVKNSMSSMKLPNMKTPNFKTPNIKF